MKYHLDIDIKC